LYLYSSIAGLLLAVFALVARRNRTTGLFGLMLLFGAFWMLGDKTIVWRALYPLLPEQIRIGIHPEYTYCIFSLAIAGLAAAGLDGLRVPDWGRWAIGIVIVADLFFVGSGRPMNLSSSPGVLDDPNISNGLRNVLNKNVPPWRFDTVDTSIEWTTAAPILQLPCAAGISPMAPENAIQLRLFLHDGFRWGWNYPLEKLDSPVVDLLNVRYVVTRAEDMPRFATLPKFRHIGSLPGNELFENADAYPRFFLVHQLRGTATREEVRAVNLRDTAIVEESPSLPAGTADMRDQVETLRYEPNLIEVSAKASRGALLVLSETYYPGWKAWLDGRPTPIYETDIALRGIVVPPGTHHVRLEFRPSILPMSLGISLGTAILLAFFAFRSKRSRGHVTIEMNGK
ncbi:MAG TPA: YfhO family protein, partial [Bryobacteraceae bacterium]|nr:YfhO family protein [Bryobacteraceae bacterium]